jgi:hypothetical protein
MLVPQLSLPAGLYLLYSQTPPFGASPSADPTPMATEGGTGAEEQDGKDGGDDSILLEVR